MNVTSCKACQARIIFVPSEAHGRKMPLDATSTKGVVLVTLARGPGTADETVARVVDVYVPHHRTCPRADEFRRARG